MNDTCGYKNTYATEVSFARGTSLVRNKGSLCGIQTVWKQFSLRRPERLNQVYTCLYRLSLNKYIYFLGATAIFLKMRCLFRVHPHL